MVDPSSVLASGLHELKLAPGLSEPLLAYLAELVKWNAAYNLTAVRDPVEMVTRHLLDSLAVLSAHCEGTSRLIDVGAGAGLPGIPLALACPHWHVAVLDSNGKKARFLRHAVRVLGLANVEVIESRADRHVPAQTFDAVITRAFASLAEMVRCTDHLVAEGGRWLAMKGRLDDNEVNQLPAPVGICARHRLHVPGLHEERHLVVLSRRSPPDLRSP
ncbi:MAG: 16S rRNA (guanine(527)-N(7))-methyltransferase RsmG [Panacagrimonas sp.]